MRHPVEYVPIVHMLSAVAECQARCQGMTAENMQRQALGKPMAFVEDSFQRIIDEMKTDIAMWEEIVRNMS